MNMQRRTLIQAGAVAVATSLAVPAYTQSLKKLRVGYLHTPAVDGQLWLGMQMGSFAQQGLDIQPTLFNTGLEIFQAMIGGSLDVLTTGAVVSNFPARGQGKVFLLNDIEYGTAQLWVRDDSIKTLADLKGKQISTTTGTTAHVFLDRVLNAAKLDPAKDVQIVNQRMPDVVTSFIGGAVSVAAIWVPFDILIKSKVGNARMLVDASAYYPQAAIMGGWAARNDFYDANKPLLRSLVTAWAQANDEIVKNPDAAAEQLQKTQYKDVPLDEFRQQFKQAKYFSSKEWRAKMNDGSVTQWLQGVTDFFVKTGNIQNPVPANKYFDPSVYLEAIKG